MAVENSKKAFRNMVSNKPPLQRARIMFKFKELIEKNSDELNQTNSFRAWKSIRRC